MGDRRRETTFYLIGILLLSSLWAVPGSFPKEDNQVASIEYQRHIRKCLLTTVAQVKACNEFLSQTRTGKYAGEKAGLEQRSYDVINGLRDSIGELNSRQGPLKFVKGHQMLAQSHRWCYESVKDAQAAYFEDDASEKKRLFSEAQTKLDKAWSLVQRGKAEIKRNVG